MTDKKHHRIKCPICGSLLWESQLNKEYQPIVVEMISQGKAHGFKTRISFDSGLFEKLKLKVKRLYHRFFGSDFIVLDTNIGLGSYPKMPSELRVPAEVKLDV